MPDCRTCGARVLVVELPAEPGERSSPAQLILDVHEAAYGAGRYAIWDDGSCHPVAAAAQVLAHPLHQCTPPMRR